MSPLDHAEDYAKKLANNHAKFQSFDWNHDAQPDDKHLWAIVYTSNRDSGCLDQSNEAQILKALKPFTGWHKDGETVETLSHSHWAVGHVDGFMIRVYEADGTTITPAFLVYSELLCSLADYPILNEEDHSEREQVEADQTWANCYREKDRIEYIRDNREQFEFSSFADMLRCVRGKHFAGYASELLSG